MTRKDPEFGWSRDAAPDARHGLKDTLAVALLQGGQWVGGLSILYNLAAGNIQTPAQRVGTGLVAASVYAAMRIESAFLRPKK